MSNTPELTSDGNDHAMPDLQVVDDAFGPNSDLYQDCLLVSANAAAREIQNAFLAQRRELFRKLEQGLDCNKQMDAVVLAVRILGDTDLRAQYDDMRFERMQRASYNPHPKRTPEHPKTETRYPASDTLDTTFDSEIHNHSSSDIQRAPKRRARIVTPEPKVDDATIYTCDDTVTVDLTLDQTIDDMTIMSGDTHLLVPANRSFLDRMTDECFGALEDTSKSLEEVFSVFTLQDEEIDAVAKRIRKAQRQMYMGI